MTELLTNPTNADKLDVSKSQWFTPPALAERLVNWAYLPSAYAIDHGTRLFRVLEPSCGQGALIAPWMQYRVSVTCVDVDPRNIVECGRRFGDHVLPMHGDFLGMEFEAHDLVLMNPPFEGGQTEAHILHALKWADRVVCHCPLTTLEGVKRKAALWDSVSLTRMVIHARRPKYSGAKAGGATAMCTVEVAPEYQDGVRTAIEWW